MTSFFGALSNDQYLSVAPTLFVSPTLPEPASDIRAQIDALLDPVNPKDAVFIAGSNRGAMPTNLPPQVIEVDRPEGVLLTVNQAKAEAFGGGLTDDTLGQLLGYPEPKSRVMARGEGYIVQGLGHGDSVVIDMLATPEGVPVAFAVARWYSPTGAARVVTIQEALQRRLRLLAEEFRQAEAPVDASAGT